MPARIFATLRTDRTDLQRFKTLLEQQVECLRTRDMESLVDLNEQIDQLTARLQASGQTRSAALQALGFPISKAGMQQFLARHADSKNQTLWTEFSALARECQAGNQLSGELLALQQEMTSLLLDQLGRGESSGSGYAQDGSDERYGQTTSLGFA